MSAGVFQKNDPPPPPPARRVCTVYPPPLMRGEDTLGGWRGEWGVNILEDAKQSSVLYICKYFVIEGMRAGASIWSVWTMLIDLLFVLLLTWHIE
jgi:hypothetical protein